MVKVLYRTSPTTTDHLIHDKLKDHELDFEYHHATNCYSHIEFFSFKTEEDVHFAKLLYEFPGGSFWLSDGTDVILPDNLIINGSLDIRNNSLKNNRLPDNLTIENDLIIRGRFRFLMIPFDTKILGNIVMSKDIVDYYKKLYPRLSNKIVAP